MKQRKNVTGTLCDSHTKESGIIATEGSLIGNKDTFTRNLCNIYTKERKWVNSG